MFDTDIGNLIIALTAVTACAVIGIAAIVAGRGKWWQDDKNV